VGKREYPLEKAIEKSASLINPTNGPIIELYRNSRYNDEPLLYQFTARYGKGELSGGMAFDKERAAMKALGEAIERYCLTVYRRNELQYESPKKLGQESLDLQSITSFSPTQLKEKRFKNCKFDQSTRFWWTPGYSLTQRKRIWIPAQLIFMPYKFEGESVIRLPITTGAAAGTTLDSAIIRGIFEIVERDAFMIFYLNKLAPSKIKLTSSTDSVLQKIAEAFRRYRLELFVFDITTDLPVTSVMAVIVDRTGFGPAISVGLKASLDPKTAIIGAVEEAQHGRVWIRDEKYAQGVSTDRKVEDDGIDLLERGLFWADLRRIKDLNFWLNSKNIVNADEFISFNSANVNTHLETLVRQFHSKNLEIVFADVTRKEVGKAGFFVVKVVIPALQPLYLTEEYKYLGGERLYSVPEILGFQKKPTKEQGLNTIPHPFL